MPSNNTQQARLPHAAWDRVEEVVQSGSLEDFQRLCFLVEDLPSPVEHGCGALGYAVFHCQFHMVQWWISEYGSQPRKSWAHDRLIRSAIKGQGSCDKLLLLLSQNGCPLDARDDQGKSLLHAAAWLGDDVATRFLLAHGAEPCCRDLTGWTPLRWAIRGGHCKVVDLLLRNNANPYAECPAGVSDAVFAMSSAQIGMDERFRPFVEHSQLSEASCQNQEGGSGSRRL